MVRLFAFRLELQSKELVVVLAVQAILGWWRPAIQCRRACMYCFHEKWRQLHRSRVRHLALDGKVKGERLLAIALAPKMLTTLAAPGTTWITCAEASLEEGGVCSASTLSNKGLRALAQCHTQLQVDELDKLVFMEALRGIGGVRQTADLESRQVARYDSLGTSRSAKAVMVAAWPVARLFTSGGDVASRATDCIRGHGCRAAHVIPELDFAVDDGVGQVLAGRKLDLSQSLSAALPHLKVSWLGKNEAVVLTRSSRIKEQGKACYDCSSVYGCADKRSGTSRPHISWTSGQISSYADSKTAKTNVQERRAVLSAMGWRARREETRKTMPLTSRLLSNFPAAHGCGASRCTVRE